MNCSNPPNALSEQVCQVVFSIPKIRFFYHTFNQPRVLYIARSFMRITHLHSQKINSFIDQKTAWITELDKTNIAKNKAHGIEPPKDAVSSISHIISGAINSKLQAAGPVISLVTSKLAGGSSGGHGGGSGGFNFGALLGGSGGGAHATASAGYGA